MGAGTTPTTTLREPLIHIFRNNNEDPAPSRQTYKTDDLHFIITNKMYSFNPKLKTSVLSIKFVLKLVLRTLHANKKCFQTYFHHLLTSCGVF